VHTGWLLHRLAKMPAAFPTSEVTRNLKISVRVVQRWLADPYFRGNKIAQKSGAQWIWNKEKLKVWLIAVFRLDQMPIAENPGPEAFKFGYETARQELEMPLNYSVRLGHEIGEEP